MRVPHCRRLAAAMIAALALAGRGLVGRIGRLRQPGTGVDVTGSRVIDKRMPEHGEGEFYSDHGAVVTDLKIS